MTVGVRAIEFQQPAGIWFIVIPSLWVCAGVVLYTGIQSTIVGYCGHRVPIYLVFALSCFCAAVYQFELAQYYLAPDSAHAASALRWQMGAIILFLPAFLNFAALYTGKKFSARTITVTLGVFFALLVVNFLSPFSARFSSLEADGVLRLPWGETLALYRGVASSWSALLRILYVIVLGWALWRALVQYRRGEKRAAFFLAACTGLLVATTTWGALIDLGYIRSFYTSGYAFLGLALMMSVSMGIELRERTLRLEGVTTDLQCEIKRRQDAEGAIRHIAAGTSAETGSGFFRRLTMELTILFRVDFAVVGTINKDDISYLCSLATYQQGVLIDNLNYSLDHTAFGQVTSTRSCVYEAGVRTVFPRDALLSEMSAESYIGTPLVDSEGAVIGLIALLHSKPLLNSYNAADILEICAARAAAELQRLNAEREMRRLAYHDYLTGLANRAAFHQHLTDSLSSAKDEQRRGALLLIDLDHFKTINDGLSHAIGDEVLREVGRRLNAIDHRQVFVARIGGDEFVAIIHPQHTDARHCAGIAHELAQAIATSLAHDLALGEHRLNVGASIGIALFPQDDATPLDVLRRADMALYRAKNMGRGIVQFYETPMQGAAQQRLTLEKGLRVALEQNQFELYYQPQVDIAGAMIGAEALLRWRNSGQEIGPEAFIPVAEESGLIHAIGRWVLEQACRHLAQWQQDRFYIGRLSVNVSPWQFARADFVKQVEQTLTRHGADPHSLSLEITETALVYDLQETAQKLSALRSMGLHIALDDFGTGYSSLAYLRALPLDVLKIDKAFVIDLGLTTDHGMVENIISIGRNMGILVLAEGVETPLQHKLLRQMGCMHFQGFLFSHPLSESALRAWVLARHTRDVLQF